jgi:pimeloyl-ACP methyl ester carboxylesterase
MSSIQQEEGMRDRPLPPDAITAQYAAQTSLKPNPMKRTTLCKTYDVDCTRVIVTWQEYQPEDKDLLPGKAIVFLPGWPLRAESQSIRRLTEELANNSATRTYVLHTRSKDIVPASLYQEARAICLFLKEVHAERIIFVGYSQGSIKAINILALLQEIKSDILVEGLILVVPVGLIAIGGKELVRRYIVDALFVSFMTILREVLHTPHIYNKLRCFVKNTLLILNASLVFFYALFKDIRAFRWGYLARFKNDLTEMSRLNPYLSKIRVPVVLIQGSKDFVSDHAKLSAQVSAQQERRHSQNISREEVAFSKQGLAKIVFPQSPAVTVVVAQKFGSHLLPLLRSESIARASLYLLRRSRGKAELIYQGMNRAHML